MTRALAALRVTTRMTEWHETTPKARPYTFSVVALARSRLYGGSPVLDERVVRAIPRDRDAGQAAVARLRPRGRGRTHGGSGARRGRRRAAARSSCRRGWPGDRLRRRHERGGGRRRLLLDSHVAEPGPRPTLPTTSASPRRAWVSSSITTSPRPVRRRPSAAGPGLAAVGTAILLLSVIAEAA